MKKLLSICLLFTVLFSFTGCSEDKVQKDLLNYINKEMKPLAKVEEQIIAEYESETGDNYTDDESLYNALNDSIIPQYNDFIEQIEAITPETPEVTKVHNVYIDAANTQAAAFVQALGALENQDLDAMSEVNEKLSKARAGMRDYSLQLEELAKEHNVEFTEGE
jgi:hypothetical protein